MPKNRPNKIIKKNKSANVIEFFYVKYDDSGKRFLVLRLI